MSILAVGAHPDDIEINCAGTLARYAQQGAYHRLGLVRVALLQQLEQRPDIAPSGRERRRADGRAQLGIRSFRGHG